MDVVEMKEGMRVAIPTYKGGLDDVCLLYTSDAADEDFNAELGEHLNRTRTEI